MKLQLDKLSAAELKKLYLRSKSAYYETTKPILSDADFDKLEDHLKQQFPNWVGFKTGAETKNKKTKMALPIPMGSLDKVKPEGFDRWKAKVRTSEVVISDKLDGLSLEIQYTDGVPVLALTRGDGKIGGNVSYLIPHMKIPQKVGTANFIVRCEVLFSSPSFAKYAKEFDHPRNAASGLLNSQEVHRAVKDLSVVVLDVLKPRAPLVKSLAWAKAKGFTIVPHRVIPVARLTGDLLTKILTARKSSSKYGLDGLVLTLNKLNVLPTSGNPDYSIAFKFSTDGASNGVDTKIKEVEWNVSHLGTLTPRIKFDPVPWEGATLSFATAFNAQFVLKHKLGPGAVVTIVRSGEIIPFITKVVKPAVKIQLPDPAIVGAYTLVGVNYVLTSPKENSTYRVKRMVKFFSTMGVDFIKIGTVQKLFDAGFINLNKLLKATPTKLVAVGLTQATANKLYKSIQTVFETPLPLTKLLAASATFPRGMGERRFSQIGQHHDIMKLAAMTNVAEKKALVAAIPGFGDKNATTFVRGLENFVKWQELLAIPFVNDTGKPIKKAPKREGPLSEQRIAWTGYRSKEEELQAKLAGADIVGFDTKTTILIYSPTGKSSGKVATAEKRGIPTMTWDQLVKKYKL